MIKALLLAGLISTATVPAMAQTPLLDKAKAAYFADWEVSLHEAGKIIAPSEHKTALTVVRAIKADGVASTDAIDRAMKVCRIMQGGTAKDDIAREITANIGREKLKEDYASRVRWILAQTSLNSAARVICPTAGIKLPPAK